MKPESHYYSELSYCPQCKGLLRHSWAWCDDTNFWYHPRRESCKVEWQLYTNLTVLLRNINELRWWQKRTRPFLMFVYSFVGPVDVTIQAKCNPCLSNPCKNDGTCNNDPVDFYRCTCPYGFKVRPNHSWEITLPIVCFLSTIFFSVF